MARMRMNQAIAAAIGDEMRENPDVVTFGEDVAVAGGPFKTSDGLLEEFGPLRVRDTPIAEMGFMGARRGGGRHRSAAGRGDHVRGVLGRGARPAGHRGGQVQLPVRGNRARADGDAGLGRRRAGLRLPALAGDGVVDGGGRRD